MVCKIGWWEICPYGSTVDSGLFNVMDDNIDILVLLDSRYNYRYC